MPEQPQVLIISGTMGTGKTTVLYEASDILTEHQIAHAAIEMDALGVSFDPARPQLSHDLMLKNLTSVWTNYAAVGINRALIARAVDNERELEGICRAIPGANIVVGRLVANLSVAEERVRVRDCGLHQEKFVARVSELDALLDEIQLEGFKVRNDQAHITDVTREFLMCAGWLNHT